MSEFSDLEKTIADCLFEKGAIQFGAFKLKLHEKNPDAPLSPIYLNLRTPDHPTKPGPLDEKTLELIGACLHKKILQQGLIFSAITGIPRAGEALVEGLIKNIPQPRGFQIIKLDKEEKDGFRQIIPRAGYKYRPGEIVLLIDDLVTEADTKLEAIESLESQGVKVHDLLVLVDREQGGAEQLEQLGYHVHVVFPISTLLGYYLKSGKISQEQYTQTMSYLFSDR